MLFSVIWVFGQEFNSFDEVDRPFSKDYDSVFFVSSRFHEVLINLSMVILSMSLKATMLSFSSLDVLFMLKNQAVFFAAMDFFTLRAFSKDGGSSFEIVEP